MIIIELRAAHAHGDIEVAGPGFMLAGDRAEAGRHYGVILIGYGVGHEVRRGIGFLEGGEIPIQLLRQD